MCAASSAPRRDPDGRLTVGDRVRYSDEWLRKTGNEAGLVHYLRGAVTDVIFDARRPLVVVRWDGYDLGDLSETRVLADFLERC